MNMEKKAFWFDLGSVASIPQRGARILKTPHRDIAIFRTAVDEIFALENKCPHKGGPLSEGMVLGRKVTCPLHGLVIHLESGEVDGEDRLCARSFPVKIENGRIYLDMTEATPA